ncbi:MAG: hypothetical protein ACD_4C00089G0002, partial [uncultured bacterium (gcode 4)]
MWGWIIWISVNHWVKNKQMN